MVDSVVLMLVGVVENSSKVVNVAVAVGAVKLMGADVMVDSLEVVMVDVVVVGSFEVIGVAVVVGSVESMITALVVCSVAIVVIGSGIGEICVSCSYGRFYSGDGCGGGLYASVEVRASDQALKPVDK